MRKTRFTLAGQLAGLVAAVVGTSAKEAAAADLEVNTARTTPVVTSNANAGPGNVTVTTTGSITVTSGSAITVDSSHSVNIQAGGAINTNDVDNATGIHILGTGLTGTITQAGTINLLESFVLADGDTDGDIDGAWASGTGRTGILLDPGIFTGDITASGPIFIEGNNSYGIRLQGLLDGDLTKSSTLTVQGDNGVGVSIEGGVAGGVTGDVNIDGSVVVRGINSRAIVVNGPVTGVLRLDGTIIASGYHDLDRPVNPAVIAALDADDLLQGGPAVEINRGIGGGVHVVGFGVEDDVDDDDDGITEAAGDTDDDFQGVVQSFGIAPAIVIRPDASAPASVAISAAAGTGFALYNQGTIQSDGVYDTFAATTILVEGLGANTATLAGGIRNDGTITAQAYDADATGIRVGAGASALTIENRKTMQVISTSDLSTDAVGLQIDLGGTVNTVTNSGSFVTRVFGETGTATAIRDAAGTITTINNSGSIEAQVIATDDDVTDNIPPPAVTGQGIAIDLTGSGANVTLNQVADTPFLDGDPVVAPGVVDTVDDDVNSRPPVQIRGDIIFGGGSDIANLFAGSISGNLEFGANADFFNIDNGATYVGQLTDSGGDLTIVVTEGRLGLAGGTSNITTASFSADAELGVLLSPVPADTTVINASGGVSFAAGAVITPAVPAGLPSLGTNIFLTALGGVTVADPLNTLGTVDGEGVPYLYNIVLSQPNANQLQADYAIKNAAQLGFNANEGIALNPIIAALQQDAAASAAIASLDTAAEFEDAYEDLMPSFSSAAAELAATAVQQGQSATTNRLSATRLHDINDVSVWAQEIGYGLTRTPIAAGAEYTGHGFGLAAGIDGPLNNGGLFGLSFSFISSEVEEAGRPEGEIAASFGQVNAYLGTAMGPFDIDFVLGAGGGKLSSRRFVEIGPAFDALSEAEWWAYEGHGSARISAPLALGDFLVVTPLAAVTYVGMNEEGYTEEGGGVAIDYEVASAFSQRLWGDAGIEFAGRFRILGDTIFSPRLMLGYRANLINEAAERDIRFVSGGTPFTLTDDELDDGAPLVNLGFDASNGYSTVSIAYEGEFGEQIERHSINASVRFRF